MSNPNESNAFLGDVSCSAHTLMCGYYKVTKDYIHECHNVMRVFFLYDVIYNILYSVVQVLQSNRRLEF
jgi:hypothetical protein